MNYPLISEYVAAIKNAADNLDKLQGLQPVFDDYGEPVHSSGAFAVVFKMVDENRKCFALKCFTEEQTGRAEAYKMIAEELEIVNSSYMMKVEYYDKELFVDSNITEDTEFPVLLMDWIEGVTMDVFIADNYKDEYEMSWLCYRFCKMAAWLRSQPFAHGDIKPDNIIVKEDGELVLIDYDGMYVPAMKGQKSPTLGTKDFVHPLRKIEDFDETIDDFSLASIALSLRAMSLDSSLYDKYAAPDRLLFSAKDYAYLVGSELSKTLSLLMTNQEFQKLFGLFILALSCGNLSSVSFRTFIVSKPEKERQLTQEEIEKLCEVTKEELESIEWDETGAKYSKDGKRLLEVLDDIEVFEIKSGTKVICGTPFIDDFTDYFCLGFYGCYKLTSINIPSSVVIIGDGAFNGCASLTSINIPSSVSRIGSSSFMQCESLTSITIPSSVTSIGYEAFRGCTSLTSINIPSSVKSIRGLAFLDCTSLISINIPSSVTSIEGGTFWRCSNLTSINIPSSVTSIGCEAFCGCESLTLIDIPSSVMSIGKNAFNGCSSLTYLNIPSSVTSIEGWAFAGCTRLASINIPSSVTSIEGWTFAGCTRLTSINIPSSVTSIGRYAFSGCTSLTSIDIPPSVTYIAYEAFSRCTSLTSINIPPSVTDIEDCTFSECTSLTSINLPSSVKSIENCAFSGCTSLTSINIPSSVTSIGNYAFSRCSSLTSINIPSSVTDVLVCAFAECTSLTSIDIVSSEVSIECDAFTGCTNLVSIFIPIGTKQRFEKMLPEELHGKLIEIDL